MAEIETHPWTDPIIEEVREAIAARYDYDVEKIAAALAERSKVAGRGNASPAIPVTTGGEKSVSSPATTTG